MSTLADQIAVMNAAGEAPAAPERPPRIKGGRLFAVLKIALPLLVGFGPQIVGVLSDALGSLYGVEAIRYALLIVGLAKVWGAVHSVIGSRSLTAELEAARE